jgi:hypothetical protein
MLYSLRGLLTLALLEKPAQAQAETITTRDRSTFNQTFFICTDEFVQIRGTLTTVAHTTIDENGVRHSTFRFTIQGRGESTSGAKYVFLDVFNTNDTVTGDPAGNFNATLTRTAKLIRQGSDTPTDDRESKFLIHVTLNENGEVTADVFKAEAECT